MAILGRWTGGVTTLLPGTSWAAPNALFPTQQRNDSSAYSFTSSTSTLTLPASGLAHCYLIIASFEFEDTSNGRHQPQGKFVQTVGTSDFVSAFTSGFNRDNSEDRAFVRTWALVDQPSGSNQIQFQWKRDSDTPIGGTVISSFEVIPLYYSNIGIYSSSQAAVFGGTTPNTVGSYTTIRESDTSAIEISGSVVTCKSDNKKYLVLGSYFLEGTGNNRSQRWGGLEVDGVQENAAKAYTYYRNTANDEGGEFYTHHFETETSDVTLEQYIYRGDGVGAGQGGADNDGGSTPVIGEHAFVVIELNDSAESFHSVDSVGGVDLNVTGPVDQVLCRTSDISFNDSDSFTRADDNSMNCVGGFDGLFGANISAAQEVVGTTSRWTARAHITVNGVEDNDSRAGDYARNNQGSIDTFGWSANLLSFRNVSDGDDVGVSVQELSGGEDGGQYEVQPGWSGFWGINLDSLQAAAGGEDNVSEIPTSSIQLSAQVPSSLVTEKNFSNVSSTALQLNSNSPTSLVSENNYSDIPLEALELTSNAPQSLVTETNFSNIPLASLLCTSFAPQSVVSNIVENLAGPDGLDLTGPDGEILHGPDHVQGGNSSLIPVIALELNAFALQSVVSENNYSSLPSTQIDISANAPSSLVSENNFSSIPLVALNITANVLSSVISESNYSEIPSTQISIDLFAPQSLVTNAAENLTGPDGFDLTGPDGEILHGPDHVQEGVNVSEIPLNQLALNQNAPVSVVTENNFSNIPATSITITLQPPSSLVTENNTSEIPSTQISITTYPPISFVSDVNISNIPKVDIALTAYPLTSEVSEDTISNIPVVQLALQANAPRSFVTINIGKFKKTGDGVIRGKFGKGSAGKRSGRGSINSKQGRGSIRYKLGRGRF